VGPKTAVRLEAEFGVRTVGELCTIPLAALQARLGEHHGAYLHRICRGQDDSLVVTEWEPKSISRETTYEYDTNRRDAIVRTITDLAGPVARDLRGEGMRARTVTLKIRYRDFKTHTRALTLPEATDDVARIREVAVSLLDRFDLDRPVRLVGVRVSGFVGGPEGRLPL
jgi:DNA polymerase-4